jgi:hypothetical protein
LTFGSRTITIGREGATTCLMVWVGTLCPVLPVAKPAEPTAQEGYHYVEEVPADAPIRSRFTTPHVTYVGSYEGCGCGFNSGNLAWQGIDDVADALELLGAMTVDEREEFLAEQRSRTRLRDLVRAALDDGPVEVYACWAGDEDEAPVDERTIAPAWLTDRTAPLGEGVHYSVSVVEGAAPAG